MKARWLRIALAAAVAACLMFTGCQRNPQLETEPLALAAIETVSPESWSLLAQQRIYFGHQSVGDNIMQGVESVVANHPRITLEVRETTAAEAIPRGVFAHGKVGQNFSYQSKLQGFAELMDSGLGDRVDIALLKFCYVDIMPDTDVRQMFRDYGDTMARLAQRYPQTQFVHVSEPLTWRLTGARAAVRGAKDLVKEALGRSGYGRFFDNAPRNQFNALLQARYGGREPLFDLAAIESSNPDGSRVAYELGGKTHFAMASQYTDDGGHLNEVGRQRVAEQLLVFLADLAVEKETSARVHEEGRLGPQP